MASEHNRKQPTLSQYQMLKGLVIDSYYMFSPETQTHIKEAIERNWNVSVSHIIDQHKEEMEKKLEAIYNKLRERVTNSPHVTASWDDEGCNPVADLKAMLKRASESTGYTPEEISISQKKSNALMWVREALSRSGPDQVYEITLQAHRDALLNLEEVLVTLVTKPS